MNKKAKGQLAIQVLAMPKDTNPSGDIFGGWLLSQMDLAGAIFSTRKTKGRVVTVAIESIEFKQPVCIGDTVSVYVAETKRGRTSLTVHIEVFVTRNNSNSKNFEETILVTQGNFTYVKVDSAGKPNLI